MTPASPLVLFVVLVSIVAIVWVLLALLEIAACLFVIWFFRRGERKPMLGTKALNAKAKKDPR